MNVKKLFPLTFLILLGFYLSAFHQVPAQSRFYEIKYQTDTVPVTDSIFTYDKVDVEVSFAGGEIIWRKFVMMNVNGAVPSDNGAKPGIYTVIVQFVVDTDGKISDIKPLTKHGHGMEDEVMRVIRKGPNWIPAMKDGHPVRAIRMQPVTFQVTKD